MKPEQLTTNTDEQLQKRLQGTEKFSARLPHLSPLISEKTAYQILEKGEKATGTEFFNRLPRVLEVTQERQTRLTDEIQPRIESIRAQVEAEIARREEAASKQRIKDQAASQIAALEAQVRVNPTLAPLLDRARATFEEVFGQTEAVSTREEEETPKAQPTDAPPVQKPAPVESPSFDMRRLRALKQFIEDPNTPIHILREYFPVTKAGKKYTSQQIKVSLKNNLIRLSGRVNRHEATPEEAKLLTHIFDMVPEESRATRHEMLGRAMQIIDEKFEANRRGKKPQSATEPETTKAPALYLSRIQALEQLIVLEDSVRVEDIVAILGPSSAGRRLSPQQAERAVKNAVDILWKRIFVHRTENSDILLPLWIQLKDFVGMADSRDDFAIRNRGIQKVGEIFHREDRPQPTPFTDTEDEQTQVEPLVEKRKKTPEQFSRPEVIALAQLLKMRDDTYLQNGGDNTLYRFKLSQEARTICEKLEREYRDGLHGRSISREEAEAVRGARTLALQKMKNLVRKEDLNDILPSYPEDVSFLIAELALVWQEIPKDLFVLLERVPSETLIADKNSTVVAMRKTWKIEPGEAKK